MIRPVRDEVARYGDYSKAGESVYDHPFQWGSKRTGPDLAREGGKYPDSWHFNHMYEPGSMSTGSIMPPYPWLLRRNIDASVMPAKIRVMQKLGVPYPKGYDQLAIGDMEKQAAGIAANLAKDKIEVKSNKEIIALIAYLQRLGTDIKVADKVVAGR
jgi:cytochrome c oxidase cbb3-type subunit I/II